MSQKKVLMDSLKINNVLNRITDEILTQYNDLSSIAVIGIQTGGAHLARRIVNIIKSKKGHDVELGIVDITLYRDDITLDKDQPIVKKTSIPFKISGKTIILVDDVLYTGRTVRAALDAVIDFGRPQAIRLAVMIDRGLREFPIRPDYIGETICTCPSDNVAFVFTEDAADEDMAVLEMGE